MFRKKRLKNHQTEKKKIHRIRFSRSGCWVHKSILLKPNFAPRGTIRAAGGVSSTATAAAQHLAGSPEAQRGDSLRSGPHGQQMPDLGQTARQPRAEPRRVAAHRAGLRERLWSQTLSYSLADMVTSGPHSARLSKVHVCHPQVALRETRTRAWTPGSPEASRLSPSASRGLSRLTDAQSNGRGLPVLPRASPSELHCVPLA